MNSDHHTSTWLLESQLEPYVDAFMLHLFDCRYASNTINNYLAGLTHFAHWITQCNIDIKSIDEQLIQHFLDDHLPRCNCEKPAFHDSALKPDHIRQFVASQSALCSVPASLSAPISALRGYFRYRATLGVFRPARNIARFRMF